LSIFQLPAVKLLEVLAHYANTGKETDRQTPMPWLRRAKHSVVARKTFTAVSIKFWSRPMQAVPVASWLFKHS